jgi:circadian clock protein KaiC
LQKAPTGIRGLDEITEGGLPLGRPTLITGGPGCGKTLLAMEFLVNGATEYGESGVYMAFEENAEELAQNVASLGFDLKKLQRQKKVLIEYVRVERAEIEEAGEYDLEGLFIRLGSAVERIGAKRVVLDTVEALFSSLQNHAILRAELRRLFRWLKDRGLTAIITAERGQGTMTRFGLEEYVADCVITLDHRANEQISTRRLRIVKYRGSLHGTNEYPFLIGRHGISVMPITSSGLEHGASSERISSGVKELDQMLGGKGFYRGSSILVTGTAGTGKSSLAAAFVESACRRGERCLYLAFEESRDQIIRNMRSIGIDLQPYLDRGLLRIQAARASLTGLEMHLLSIRDLMEEWKPQVMVVDPITDFGVVGTALEVKAAVARMIDFMKSYGTTALLISLVPEDTTVAESVVGISSVTDTWITLRNLEINGERHRGLYILKSRGMAHSHQIRSFLLTDEGIRIGDLDQAGRRSGPSSMSG